MASAKVSANPATHTVASIYKLLIGSVVPRPIAFVSTISKAGSPNLAPFSFFNAICSEPPAICFSVANRTPAKDTVANIRANGEFVVNIVTEAIAEQMNLCSGDYAPGISEFEVSGLTPDPSEVVRPPCVRESPVNMECKLIQIIEVSTKPSGASLIIGEVVRFHFDPAIAENFRIDPFKLRAIGRMGGAGYIRTSDYFEMIRPRIPLKSSD